MKTLVSNDRLINYIRRNPGLTTTQLCRLLRGKTETNYTKTSFNDRLIKLTKQGVIVRRKGNGACSDKLQVWRHYNLGNPVGKPMLQTGE